jgi:hypothetical protein
VGGRQVFPGSLFSETFVYFSNHVHRRLLSQANDFPSTTSAMFFLAPMVFRGSDTLALLMALQLRLHENDGIIMR